jgi:LysM repeat protein
MAWITGYRNWLSESESLNNAQMVVNHFVGTDWTKEALSALCGNMRHESSIQPDMYEYGYAWEDDRGYGLVQWTPRSKYWDWAVANGLPPESGDSQLERIDYEVDNNIQWIPKDAYGDMTFTEFRTNAGGWTVDYLTEAFTWGYERPNEQAGWDSMPDRKAFAQRCFNELDFTGTGSGGGGTNPPPSNRPTRPISNKTPLYKYETEGTYEKMTYHKVQSGQTLSAIAKRYGVPLDSIKRVKFQEIPNKGDIDAGEILLLPTAKKAVTVTVKPKQKIHVVQSGENLSTIAKDYGTTIARLASKNGLKNPDKIFVGQKLKI